MKAIGLAVLWILSAHWAFASDVELPVLKYDQREPGSLPSTPAPGRNLVESPRSEASEVSIPLLGSGTIGRKKIIDWASRYVGSDKHCVFSIEVIGDGGGLSRIGDTRVGDGFHLYEEAGGWIVGDRREAWHGLSEPNHVSDIDVFGGSPEFTAKIRDSFRHAHLQNVNFKALITEAQTQMDLMQEPGLLTANFPTVRVYAEFEGCRFSFDANGFSPLLDHYAPYNSELNRLAILLQGIAEAYGQERLRF